MKDPTNVSCFDHRVSIYVSIYLYIYPPPTPGLEVSLWLSFHILFYFYFLSRLHTRCGALTHDPDIKSLMIYWLNHPGAPALLYFKFLPNLVFVTLQFSF